MHGALHHASFLNQQCIFEIFPNQHMQIYFTMNGHIVSIDVYICTD